MLTWTAKDPDARLDYRWEPPLDPGDALVSASISKLEGDVTINSQEHDDTGLSVFLSGGTVGSNLFRGVWISSGGRLGDEYISINVVDNAPFSAGTAYGTDAGFTAWLYQQGYQLPSGALPPAALRARGTTYVDGYEAYWTGYRTGGIIQELAWPRIGATLNCTIPIDSTIIPPSVVNAAYRAAWLEAETPGILNGSSAGPGQRVKREKVDGAVEVEYFDDGKSTAGGAVRFIDGAIDAALSGFICVTTGSAFIWSLGS